MVYTLEAHASDEWPISSGRFNPGGRAVQIKQHTTLGERIRAARAFQSAYGLPLPIAIDSMSNEFERFYSTWPFRFYVIAEGKIIHQAQPEECTYDPKIIQDLLRKF